MSAYQPRHQVTLASRRRRGYRVGLTPRATTKTERILSALVRHDDGVSQTRLSDATGFDRSSISQAITELENLNLVRRKKSKDDGRVNNIHLLAKGRKALERAGIVA